MSDNASSSEYELGPGTSGSNLREAGVINLAGSVYESSQLTIPNIVTKYTHGHSPSSSNSTDVESENKKKRDRVIRSQCVRFFNQLKKFEENSIYSYSKRIIKSNAYGNDADLLIKLVTKYMDNNTSMDVTEAIIWAISITFKDGKFYNLDEPVKYDLMIDLIQDSNKVFGCLPVIIENIIFPLTENTAVLFDILASTEDEYVSLMFSIIMSSTGFNYNLRENSEFPLDMNIVHTNNIKLIQTHSETKYNGSITKYTFTHERSYLPNIEYIILVYHNKMIIFNICEEKFSFRVKISPDCIGMLEDYFMYNINLEMYGHVESITNTLKLRKEQYFNELQEEVNTELSE